MANIIKFKNEQEKNEYIKNMQAYVVNSLRKISKDRNGYDFEKEHTIALLSYIAVYPQLSSKETIDKLINLDLKTFPYDVNNKDIGYTSHGSNEIKFAQSENAKHLNVEKVNINVIIHEMIHKTSYRQKQRTYNDFERLFEEGETDNKTCTILSSPEYREICKAYNYNEKVNYSAYNSERVLTGLIDILFDGELSNSQIAGGKSVIDINSKLNSIIMQDNKTLLQHISNYAPVLYKCDETNFELQSFVEDHDEKLSIIVKALLKEIEQKQLTQKQLEQLARHKNEYIKAVQSEPSFANCGTYECIKNYQRVKERIEDVNYYFKRVEDKNGLDFTKANKIIEQANQFNCASLTALLKKQLELLDSSNLPKVDAGANIKYNEIKRDLNNIKSCEKYISAICKYINECKEPIDLNDCSPLQILYNAQKLADEQNDNLASNALYELYVTRRINNNSKISSDVLNSAVKFYFKQNNQTREK